MSVSDAEVEAAAVAMHDRAWAGLFQWDEAEDKARDVYLGAARAALEAAAAVREQAAAKLAEETGTAASLIYRGLDDAVAPEQVPMVPLSAVAEVRAKIAGLNHHATEIIRDGEGDDKTYGASDAFGEALDAFNAAFPQLKEQSDEH